MSEKTISGKLTCPIDGKVFETVKARNKHMKLMHPEQVFTTGTNQDIKDKKEKKPEQKVEIKFGVEPKDQIPKTSRRSNGAYSFILEKLKECPEDQAVWVVVQKRTQAGGYLKFFKSLGYDVVSRAVEDGIKVYIGKGLKSSD